ncbi:hypothetical protein ACLUXJ_04685 [Lactobacillus porci]|uniref:hypothetical protein n=1 Tax=Lactobacillus porci TaxID=2012477 RepID=UPI003994898A
METNNTSDDGRTPITLENLHEVFSSGPSDEWEKSRKFLKQKRAESERFWAEREKESRKNEDTGD